MCPWHPVTEIALLGVDGLQMQYLRFQTQSVVGADPEPPLQASVQPRLLVSFGLSLTPLMNCTSHILNLQI